MSSGYDSCESNEPMEPMEAISLVPQLKYIVRLTDSVIHSLQDIQESIESNENPYTRKRNLLTPINGITQMSLKQLVHLWLPSWKLSVAGRRVTVTEELKEKLGLPCAEVDVYTILEAMDTLFAP